MIPWMNLKRQYDRIKEEILPAVTEVLESGNYILGENLRRFEQELAAFHRAKHALGVANGTDALQLALLAVGIKEGDEVITVPNTAVPTICAIRAAGATPVFVDIDPDYATMDPAKIEAAITPKTKAIIPVHLYGQACDMDAILRIARRRKLKVVEDCAQAIGTEYHSKECEGMVGTLGDIGCLSFYPTKNLGAYGDAGAIVTNDDATAERVRLLRNYGESLKYVNIAEGFNSRLDELQARILSVKLRHLPAWIARRRAIASQYRRLLSDLDGTFITLPKEMPKAEHTYHLFVVQLDRRDVVRERLKEFDIGTSVHYPMPIHFQEAYRSLGYAQGSFPVAELFATRIISLPMFPELTDDEVATVCDCIRLALLDERPLDGQK